jgi:transcriptional regulator with XRE-family HTH domain
MLKIVAMGMTAYLPRPHRRARLVSARERQAMSRQELAERLGITRQYVMRVEEGERNPSHSLMVRWAEALHTTMDFFREDDEPQAQSAA